MLKLCTELGKKKRIWSVNPVVSHQIHRQRNLFLSLWDVLLLLHSDLGAHTSHHCSFSFRTTTFFLWSRRLWWSRQTSENYYSPKGKGRIRNILLYIQTILQATNVGWTSSSETIIQPWLALACLPHSLCLQGPSPLSLKKEAPSLTVELLVYCLE